MYKISKKHAMPDQRGTRKYPWAALEVGDSFFVPIVDLPRGVASLNAPRPRLKNGFKIARRTVTEKGVKGVRVWRVA